MGPTLKEARVILLRALTENNGFSPEQAALLIAVAEKFLKKEPMWRKILRYCTGI